MTNTANEVVKSDVIEGTVLDPAERVTLDSPQGLAQSYDSVSAQALKDAVAAGKDGVDQFNATLSDVYRGAGFQILRLTHAQTVASAYAVRLADMLAQEESKDPKAKASAAQIQAELSALDPDFVPVSDGRVTQWRNAASALIDLDFPLSDPRIGPLLSISGISTPLKLALAAAEKEGPDAGRATFLGHGTTVLEKERAARAKRRTKSLPATDTADQGEDKGEDKGEGETPAETPAESNRPVQISAETEAEIVDLAKVNLGSLEARRGRMLAFVNAMSLDTSDDYAIALDMIHALDVRLSHVTDADLIRQAKETADEWRTDGEGAAEQLAAKRTARKSTPKPGPRKSV